MDRVLPEFNNLLFLYRFSRFEAFATLSVLVRQFRIRPAFEDDYFIQPSFGFVTKPDTEIWIKVESRL